MKIYKLSNKLLGVASVGSTDGYQDSMRIKMFSGWLESKDPEYFKGATFFYDNIDLNRGRDFLKESKTYDIVILHHIFNPQDRTGLETGKFSRSPEHKVNNWIRRLQSTGADYIFVYGSVGEVAPWWLGNITGYNLIQDYNGYQSIYRNSSLPPIETPHNSYIDWDKVDVSWMEELKK